MWSRVRREPKVTVNILPLVLVVPACTLLDCRLLTAETLSCSPPWPPGALGEYLSNEMCVNIKYISFPHYPIRQTDQESLHFSKKPQVWM